MISFIGFLKNLTQEVFEVLIFLFIDIFLGGHGAGHESFVFEVYWAFHSFDVVRHFHIFGFHTEVVLGVFVFFFLLLFFYEFHFWIIE